jgi:hypothetical protein
VSDLSFELLDLFPEYEVLGLEHPMHGILDLILDLGILCLEIEERDQNGRSRVCDCGFRRR